MNTWLEELALSLISSNTARAESEKHRHNFVTSVKQNAYTYARTNQFAVTEKLIGLEEKFQVLNLDDVAAELFSRRVELTRNEVKWVPDVLDLLLHLSDDPVRHSRVENLEKSKPRDDASPPLKWEDIEAEDPIDREDPIWSVPRYSDFSSDEDEEATSSSTQTSPPSVKQRHPLKTDEGRLFDPAPIDTTPNFKTAHFWQSSNRFVTVTETQAIREALFMLGGHPTSIFGSSKPGFTPTSQYRIRHLEATTSFSLLDNAAGLASDIDMVRQWLKLRQASNVTQLVQSDVGEVLADLDRAISQEHTTLLHQNSPTGVVSFLQVLERVKTAALPLKRVGVVLSRLTSNDPVELLNAMFDRLGTAQLLCSAVQVEAILPIFLSALTAYAKPIDAWMHTGTVESSEHFFIVRNDQEPRNPTSLWHDWFTLSREDQGFLPHFLKQYSGKIFTIGKTAAFLSHLGAGNFDHDTEELGLAFAALEAAGIVASSPLPFSATFEVVLERHLAALLAISTSTLKHILEKNCGVTKLFDAFDHLYLCKNGMLLNTIESKMFDQIDRCVELWNDRFLVSDSLAEAYAGLDCVDSEAITIQAFHTSSRTMENRRRSVKILRAVSLSYHVSWPLSNIIRPRSLASYQRIALTLSQVRRAKYLLERRAYGIILQMSITFDKPTDEKITRLVFWQLSCFVNILYDHFTSCVIQPLTTSMRAHLASSTTTSLDDMISLHAHYIASLEHACLSSKRIKPLRDTLLSVLDLCIRFTDLLTTVSNATAEMRGSSHRAEHKGNDDEDQEGKDIEANSFISAQSRRHRHRRHGNAINDESYSSSDEDTGMGEGYSTFVFGEDFFSLEREVQKIRGELSQDLEFLIAGLKAVARSSNLSQAAEMGAEGDGLPREEFEIGETFELLAGALEGIFPRRRWVGRV